jgi:hypothetical protein
VCACLFGGDRNAFARTLQIDYGHIYKVFKDINAVTPALLAQVAATTDVRAEWLLTGEGPMLRGEIALDDMPSFSLPPNIESGFNVFKTEEAALPPVQIKTPIAQIDVASITAVHVAAAEAIYRARSNDQPVMLFISAPAIYAGAGIVASDFMRKKYVTSAATTGAGLLADLEMAQEVGTTNLNYVTRLAANQGVGYGEAVGRWAFAPKDNKTRSLFYAAHALGVPATAHVEIGELRFHFGPAMRGTEIGAAIGAATYVDLLVFAECVRRLSAQPNGVLLLVGDIPRGLHMFLQARAAIGEKCVTPFKTILVDNYVSSDVDDYIQTSDGSSHKLLGAYRANLMFLLHACDAVFSGTNPYDSELKSEGVGAG